MLDNNTVFFLNIIWTYCTCMYYVSEINEYYYIIIRDLFSIKKTQKTLNVHDMVNFKSMVFRYKVYNTLLPTHIMSNKQIDASQNHNVSVKNCNFKIRFSRNTKQIRMY